MKKRILALSIVGALMCTLAACTTPEAPPAPTGTDPAPVDTTPQAQPVNLTLASWRADDVAQWDVLLADYKANVAPNVTIKFQPINPPDYNTTLTTQLEAGTGPDLMFARSYQTGREIFGKGFFADVSDIAGLDKAFTTSALDAWRSDGKLFATPIAAVSHAVYYNKDIFAANNIAIPTTWAEFIEACKTLKAAGITPIANGIADEWDILECFFLNMLPNYVGGSDQRALYESGEKKMNDEAFVNAYTDMAAAAPYLPDGFEALSYSDSQTLFSTQKAAMFLDGSWNISAYDDVTFDWGFFATPGRDGAKFVSFHVDAAIAMNADSKNPEEAKAFLSWLATADGATALAKGLPTGFFPLSQYPVTLADAHANEMLALNDGKTTDVRFIWPELIDLYAPMLTDINEMLKGKVTPQQAADHAAELQAAAINK